MEKSSYSAFGLDINDAYLKVVWLDGNRHIRSHNSLKLPDEVIRNGRINNSAEFQKQVQKVIQEVKGDKIPTSWVVASLSDLVLLVKVVELPKDIKEKDVEDLIFKEYRDELPAHKDDVYLSWRRLPLATKDRQLYSVVVGEKKVIDEYVSSLKHVGLKLAGLQPDSVAVANALIKGGLHDEPQKSDAKQSGAVIVSFRPGYASLAFYDLGQIIFISTLQVSALSPEKLVDRVQARLNIGRQWYRQLTGRDLQTVITVGYTDLVKKLHESLTKNKTMSPASGDHLMNVAEDTKIHKESVNLTSGYVTAIGLAQNIY